MSHPIANKAKTQQQGDLYILNDTFPIIFIDEKLMRRPLWQTKLASDFADCTSIFKSKI